MSSSGTSAQMIGLFTVPAAEASRETTSVFSYGITFPTLIAATAVNTAPDKNRLNTFMINPPRIVSCFMLIFY